MIDPGATVSSAIPPRHTVFRSFRVAKANAEAREVAAEFNGQVASDDEDELPLPNPGDMQLHSFYTPSLEAGTYRIRATQHVVIPKTAVVDHERTADFRNDTDQKFEVVAPQFSIDPADIHSCYPPMGHADEAKILPHIVFKDAHLPWERRAIADSIAHAAKDFHHNKVPWLALLVFDPDGPDQELRLDDSVAKSFLPDSVFKSVIPGQSVLKPQSQAATMTVTDYLGLAKKNVIVANFTAATSWSTKRDGDKKVQVIFPAKKMFDAFFPATSQDGKSRDLSKYKYFSHVRRVNTVGMVLSGVQDTGTFSIVVSSRSGPTNIATNSVPRTQIVHLVSIENLDQLQDSFVGASHAGLISLASWTYQCLPPSGVNFVDTMRDIGDSVKQTTCLLRPNDAVLDSILKPPAYLKLTVSDDKAASARIKLHDRLSNGYILCRRRLGTGQETMAFNRGPLVPVKTTHDILPGEVNDPHPMYHQWRSSSNFGQTYEILDKDMGISDISYAAAWQLGKTLAMGDGNLVAVLLRIRNYLHSTSVSAVKVNVAKARGWSDRSVLLTDLSSTVDTLDDQLQSSDPLRFDPARRWRMPSEITSPTISTATVPRGPLRRAFRDSLVTAAANIGSVNESLKPFEEISQPSSTDWAQLHAWVMDKLSLASIPYQYLVPDVSYLPPESIRFFHIDQIWMDCFLDGALAVCNSVSRTDDDVRRAIKGQLNSYFSTEIQDATYLKHFPQVPTYGFLLRSKVVECMPDLRVEIPFPNKDFYTDGEDANRDRASILSLRHLGKDVLLCLLDREPASGEIEWIKFSQPEHQQCFAAGSDLTEDHIQLHFRKIPASAAASAKVSPEDGVPNFDTIQNERKDFATADRLVKSYDWDTRCLLMDGLNDQMMTQMMGPDNEERTAWSKDLVPSALVGLQLNNPVFHLKITPPKLSSEEHAKKPVDARGTPRQIWIGPVVNTGLVDPIAITAGGDASIVANRPLATAAAAVSSTTPPPQTPSSFNCVRSMDRAPSDWFAADPSKPTSSTVPPDRNIPMLNQCQFVFSCFPWNFDRKADGNDEVPSFAPTKAPYTVDLFILFTRSSTLKQNYALFEVEVRLPLGAVTPKTGADRKDPQYQLQLMNDYSGPGARMLSNQRWVVRIDREPDWLVCRLIPRSLQWTSALAKNKDLSFRLNGVDVEETAGRCGIKITERYSKLASRNPVQWQLQGSPVNQRQFLTKKDWTPPGGW